MKRYRCLFFVLIALAALLALATGASATYKISSWGTSGLKYATMAGLIDRDEYIRDYTAPILREDLAELLYDAYENMTGASLPYSYSPFSDISNRKVSAMHDLGIMTGNGDGTFSPRRYTNRQEMAKIIVCFKAAVEGKTLDLSNRDVSGIKDQKYISDWAKPYVRIAVTEKLFNGYEDGTFRPDGFVSWEQVLALIVRSGNLKTKFRPNITSPTNGQCLVTKNNLRFIFEYYGAYELYAVRVDPNRSHGEDSPKHLGSCTHNNNIMTYPYSFKTCAIYYIFAERDGVFSEPVMVYTDSKVIFVTQNSFFDPGKVEVEWLAVPDAGNYTVRITQERNSRYRDEFPAQTINTTTVSGTKYSFIGKPMRCYTIYVTAAGFTSRMEVYTGSVQKNSTTYDTLWDSSGSPTTEKEALALMKTVTIPIWKLSNGKKVSSTTTVTVHYMIADTVKQIFQEIYNGPEKFPIKSVGAFSWRWGEHKRGTAIDINPDENYCIYSSGEIVGSFWKPGVSPYSITPYGDVVTAFEKYGFYWGGDCWNSTRDYMHFGYFGL